MRREKNKNSLDVHKPATYSIAHAITIEVPYIIIYSKSQLS